MNILEVFNKKKKLSINAMSRLIEDSSRQTLDYVINTLTQINTPFDTIEAKINILSINYELYRYELYKSNEKIDVDDLMEDLYIKIFYDLNISSNDKYNQIIDDVKNKSKEIFGVKKLMAPAERFIYRLLLEQLNIKESIVPKNIIQDLLFYSKSMLNNVENMNKAYYIDIDDDKSQEEKIDFKF